MDNKKLAIGVAGAAAVGYAIVKLWPHGPEPSGTASIYGAVTDIDSGLALPDTIVVAHPVSGGLKQAITDVDGGYQIEGLPSGDCTISFSCINYQPMELTKTLVDETATEADAQMTYNPTPVGSLSGYVRDKDTGNPIEGCWVGTDYPNNDITDGTGYFEIPNIGAGSHRIGFVHPEYEYYEELIEVTSEGTFKEIELIALTAPAEASLCGIVTDALSQEPVPGVGVGVGSYTAVTDSLGEYCISGIGLGTYDVIFVKDGYETRTYRNINLTVAGDYELGTPLTPIGAGTANLYGIVRDSDGNILEGAYVSVGSYPPLYQAVTDSSGAYSISGMVPRTYWLEFTARVGNMAGKTVMEVTLLDGDNLQDAVIELEAIPAEPAPLTICRIAIDYPLPGTALYFRLGDYGSSVYHGMNYLGGIICPLSLPHGVPVIGYWTKPQEYSEPAPVVTRPNGTTEQLDVWIEVMSGSGPVKRYGPFLTSDIGTYIVDYMGQQIHWIVEPWADIVSLTSEDITETVGRQTIFTRVFTATIDILNEWNNGWILGLFNGVSGTACEKSDEGSLEPGRHSFEWRQDGHPTMQYPPYLVISRKDVPNPFYDGSEPCAEALNRGVINIPQTIGVIAAYKKGELV